MADQKIIKKTFKKNKLRPSINKGKVLILLKGEHEGKRVIFLKQFPSGNLLVTGPKSLNKVPLHKIHQRYVIATSSKINIKNVNVDGIEESLMKKPKKLKSDVLMEDEDDKTIKAENEKNKAKLEELQNIIDAEIESKVKKLEFMTEYLSSRFALKKGQYPHLMKF